MTQAPVDLNQAARMLSAIGHPARLALFRRLVQAGPAGLPAGQLAQALAMAPSSLSFHLKEMHNAGLLSSRQQGRFVIYAVVYPAMSALLAFLTDECCGGNPCLPVSPRRCKSAHPKQAEPLDVDRS